MIKRIIPLPVNQNFFLFGPRQTGKSTLLKALFPPSDTVIYYDLLHTDTYIRLTAKPSVMRLEILSAFERNNAVSHVVIDEIQRIPQLLNEVHSIIEAQRTIHFILSGSSARKLKRMHANLLAGRAWTFHLYPLSFLEMKQSFDLDAVLRFGSLPSVYCAPDLQSRYEILKSYVETYVREEIELEAQIRSLSGFLRFLPIVASENGSIVNFSNISRETLVSIITVKSYYQMLEDTLFGFFLFPYGKSIRKSTVKHPKFYFFDPGVVAALQKKTSVPLEEGTAEYGKVFEHFFLCEVIRINEYFRKDFFLYYYRTERGAEVDCIVETPSGTIFAIEVKATSNPSSVQCSGLRSFLESVPSARCILACKTPRPLIFSQHITALPWMDALNELINSK